MPRARDLNLARKAGREAYQQGRGRFSYTEYASWAMLRAFDRGWVRARDAARRKAT